MAAADRTSAAPCPLSAAARTPASPREREKSWRDTSATKERGEGGLTSSPAAVASISVLGLNWTARKGLPSGGPVLGCPSRTAQGLRVSSMFCATGRSHGLSERSHMTSLPSCEPGQGGIHLSALKADKRRQRKIQKAHPRERTCCPSSRRLPALMSPAATRPRGGPSSCARARRARPVGEEGAP